LHTTFKAFAIDVKLIPDN